jgi:hypothetical protein
MNAYTITDASGRIVGRYHATSPTDAWLAMLADQPAMRGADADLYAVYADARKRVRETQSNPWQPPKPRTSVPALF